MIKLNKLSVIIVVISIFKILLSLAITTPSIYTDEYIYFKNAQSLFQSFDISLHGMATGIYPPLYSIVLSIAFIFNDANLAYFIVKIINAFLSTLIVVPAYLLAKEFADKKKSLFTAAIIGILPMNLVFSSFIMAENLFYTLYLTSLYLIFKSFNESTIKYSIMAGIFIG